MESVDGNQEIVNFRSDQREQARRVGGRSLIATWIGFIATAVPLVLYLNL